MVCSDKNVKSFNEVGTSNPTESKASNKMAKRRIGCGDRYWITSMHKNDLAQALNKNQEQRKQRNKSHMSVGNIKIQLGTDDSN